MKLIDRYVYAVTESLPEDIREDVGKELRTNIEDMLPEDATEKDVYQVLEKLGNPWKLAEEYKPKKRYLIGPSYYDKYISTLKLVIGICISVFAGIAIFAWVVDAPETSYAIGDITKLITDLISSMFSGAIQAVLWVTLVFVILERSGVDAGYLHYYKNEWTPKDLPEIPVHKDMKISRGETVFSMFCTVLFTALVYFQPQLIAVYTKGEDGLMNLTPLFNIDRLQSYMFIIILLAMLQLGLFVWKYIIGRWRVSLAIGNAIYNLLITILFIVMFSDRTLWNMGFTDTIAQLMNTSSVTITAWLDNSILIALIVFIIISIWDSILPFIKCFRKIKA